MPPHLAPSLHNWIETTVGLLGQGRVISPAYFAAHHGDLDAYDPFTHVVRDIERDIAFGSFTPEDQHDGEYATSLQWMLATTDNDEDVALDVVHSLVGQLQARGDAVGAVQIKELEFVLSTSNSVWTVGDVAPGSQGLVERLDPTVDDRSQTVMSSGSNAAEYLRRSWSEVRALSPNYDLALDHANKALEAAAQPIVTPNNQRATLGTIIAALRAKPEKWICALGSVDELTVRLHNIWKAQYRHGEADGPIPNVEPAVARAAIHDAVTLVQWLQDGTLQPVA